MHLARRTGRARAAAFALAAVLAWAVGCGTEPSPEPSPPVSPTPQADGTPEPTGSPSPEEEPEDEATVVTVTLADGRIELSQAAFTPGDYRFVIEQEGQEAHAFAITGPEVAEEVSLIEPGADPEELEVTLEEGSYRLWCPVAGHAESGMDVTIEVAQT